MSPDEDALLNGIAADPAADLPRLVYADWLEEHGQDLRAEFIRIQCEIAKLEVGPRDVIDRNVHLWRRQQELLDGHMEALLEGVPVVPRLRPAVGPKLYRGFLDEIEVMFEGIVTHANTIVGLRPRPTRIRVISESAYHEVERGIPTGLATIVNELHIFCPAHDENDVAVVGDDDEIDTDFPYLQWPALRIITVINDTASIIPLVMTLHDATPKLTTLNLHSSAINDGDAIALLNAGILQRLSFISLIENAIGDQAAIELADRLGNSPNLKELDLRRNGITTVGQAALLARLGSKVILF